MPPPSPVPGCARGEVCIDRTASLRISLEPNGPARRRYEAPALRGAAALRLAVVVDTVLVEEREVDADQHLPLLLQQVRIGEDVPHEAALLAAGLEDAGAHVE